MSCNAFFQVRNSIEKVKKRKKFIKRGEKTFFFCLHIWKKWIYALCSFFFLSSIFDFFLSIYKKFIFLYIIYYFYCQANIKKLPPKTHTHTHKT